MKISTAICHFLNRRNTNVQLKKIEKQQRGRRSPPEVIDKIKKNSNERNKKKIYFNQHLADSRIGFCVKQQQHTIFIVSDIRNAGNEVNRVYPVCNFVLNILQHFR